MIEDNEPLVSVVVIGRNEGERLAACLRSVNAMHDPGGTVELIYVDSASTDGSPQTAEKLGARVISVNPERPSAAVGRNAGWKSASAPYVLFLDGDTCLHPDFVGSALREFTRPEIAVVWGHRREMHPESSLFNRVLDLDWIYPPGESEFCGGDAPMRRNVLESVGGFDAELIAGEEPELCQRIRAGGGIILHIDQAMTTHDLAMTNWKAYYRRAFRAGHAYAEVSERQKHTGFPLWRRDSRRNMIHAAVLLAIVFCSAAASLLLLSPWPLIAGACVLLLLAFRTSIRVAWKSPAFVTRFLYGLHSHLQQIPILMGQLAYWRDRLKNRQRMLIEYK